MVETMRWEQGSLVLLDQTLLPQKIEWITCVIGIAGTISVNTLVATMIRAVLSVKRLPIARKLKIAGIAFSARLIGENGKDIPKKR